MNLLKVLAKRNVALLLGAQSVSAMGSIVQSFALSLFVLASGSGVKFATVLAVGMIPRLFGPLTGVVVDRVNRKRLLVVLDVLAGILTVAFALYHRFVAELSLPAIYLLVLLSSSLQAFDDPAISAILPDLVESDDLTDANSVSSTISNASYIVMPVLAALLYNGVGLFVVMLFNGASFFLSALLEGGLRYQWKPQPAEARTSFRRSFAEGMGAIAGSRELILIVVVSVLANLALNPFLNVGIPYMIRINLGASEGLYGLSQSLVFVGPVVGSVLASVLLKRVDYKPLLTWVLALDAVLVAAAALCVYDTHGTFGPVRYAALCLMGFAVIATMALASVGTVTAMQKLVPGQLLGRVGGAVTSMAMLAIPLGQWLYGFGLDHWNATGTGLLFAWLVFVGFAFSLVVWQTLPKPKDTKGSASGGSLPG